MLLNEVHAANGSSATDNVDLEDGKEKEQMSEFVESHREQYEIADSDGLFMAVAWVTEEEKRFRETSH
jgi:hypothetical protein